METMKVNNHNAFTTYPNNRVCGIIDDTEDARIALDDLLASGITEDHIDIFYGAAGIEGLDAEANHHGFVAKVARKLRAYGDVENQAMYIYEDAMKNGGYVFEVLARDDKEKESVHSILLDHNAHQINYFGSWYIEAMTEA